MSVLPKREIKKVTTGLDVRSKLLSGAEKMYEAVSNTYGPAANNALLELPFGDPVLTRDGVTVAKRVSSSMAVLEDRIENMAARVLYQASEKTNKTAGDGTTATVVLARNLLKPAHRLVVAGDNAMVLKKQLELDSRTVISWIKSKSKAATNEQLLQVATVSSGDKNVGRLVAETLEEVGAEGGITIREQQYPVLDVERINGYYFDKGFFALNGAVEYEEPHILVTQKKLTSATDMIAVLQLIANDSNKRLVIVGDVAGDAQNVFLNNVMRSVIEGAIIPPMAYGQDGMLWMQDVATYVNAKVMLDGDAFTKLTMDSLGTAERVQVNQERAIMFGGAGDKKAIVDRAAEIKSQAEKETSAHTKEQLEKRYSKLVGKIAIINVGGATPTEMEELRFRVEDAIEAVKSAMADGIVPGGATTLARASELDITPLFKSALQETFKKLFENAAEPADYRLQQVIKSDWGFGFNLRERTDEPIDLNEAGIWDATRSVVQIVENATSAAGALLTTNVTVTIEDKNNEQDTEQD